MVTGLQYHTDNADFRWEMINVKSELCVADITWQLISEIGEPRCQFYPRNSDIADISCNRSLIWHFCLGYHRQTLPERVLGTVKLRDVEIGNKLRLVRVLANEKLNQVELSTPIRVNENYLQLLRLDKNTIV